MKNEQDAENEHVSEDATSISAAQQEVWYDIHHSIHMAIKLGMPQRDIYKAIVSGLSEQHKDS
jgi:hypothetical protein